MVRTRRDYYEVIGVARDAEVETIRRAFRARARELHPDVSAVPDAAERFGELAEAYSVLSRSGSRLLYDRFGYRGRGHGGFTPFSRQARQRAESEGREAATGAFEVEVGFFEAARGTTRTVRTPRAGPCAACGGAGDAQGEAQSCPSCEGSGRLSRTSNADFGRLLQIETCYRCGGRGRIAEQCPSCAGTGLTEAESEVPVTIAAGTPDGHRIVLSDGAEVVVRVLPPPQESRLVRYAAVTGLAAAVALLIVVLLA